jgi:nucleotidyltransferase/DNA polymerase involved in DNA repair
LIEDNERRAMLRAHSIGPAMIRYLEQIGIERLADLRGEDPEMIAMRMNVMIGRRHINRQGVEALRNLVALADEGVLPQPSPTHAR